MAGIAGIARANEEQSVRHALKQIEHRGVAGACVPSHTRATLGQTHPDAQECYAVGAGDASVVLDGEIHNWTDLDAAATSCIQALDRSYRSLGPAFVTRLDGPFALAIAGRDGLYLARDSLGKSPLYYGYRNEALCFASEVKALLGWADGISEFPPGHYHEPGKGLVRYARLERRPPLDQPPHEVAAELRRRLVSSVRKRTAASETGAWLSGGLDSAAMSAIARRQLPELQTFAAGIEGAPDLQYARCVADFIDAKHREMICTVDDMLAVLPEVIYHLESFDALLVRSSIMNYLVGRMASQHVPAVLSGEGGDELFAGYSYLKQMSLAEIPDELIDITGRLHNTALQRVDRCSASHGLVARTGFLDQDVVAYALRIPAEMKLGGANHTVEKWILRQALDGWLPDEVLTRPKAKFWEGSGVGELLSMHADSEISDSEFAAERTLPNGSLLNTKEELLYYRIFRERFGATLDPGLVGRTKGAPVVH